MDSVPIFEPTATPDTNILKSRLLLTKRTNPGTSDSSLTLQEKDPSDSSDLMFVSAISQPSGTTSAEEEGTNPLESEQLTENSTPVDSQSSAQVADIDMGAGELLNGVSNHEMMKEKIGERNPSQPELGKPLQSKKGPPPGLLPIEPNQKCAPETPETGRIPRKAAIKSAERTKAVAKLEKTSSKLDLEEANSPGDADATDVTVYKILDPTVETCRWCYKDECCLFQTTGRQTKTDLKFCSRKCVQQFFKYGKVHFANSTVEEEKKAVSLSTNDTSCHELDIVVEPDIEIQTLSDEFQIDCDEPESNHATVDADIETAAKDSLRCWTCKVSIFDRMDTLVWESMEFCSEKCLRTSVKVFGSHCNTCNSQVAENFLGKLCVRFGTIIRQFCTAECLERFKQSHKLCAQCQTNMTDKERKFCSPACEDLTRRLTNPTDFLGVRSCAVCTDVKHVAAEVMMTGQSHFLCSKPCRNAFRFANKLTTLKCGICCRHFDSRTTPRFLTRNPIVEAKGRCLVDGRGFEQQFNWFCSDICFATHLLRKRSIEQCPRCLVKKYNVDMIRKPTGKVVTPSRGAPELEMVFYCSLFCYSSHQPPQSRDVLPAVRTKKPNEVAQPAQTPPIPPASSASAPTSAQSSLTISQPAAPQPSTVSTRVLPPAQPSASSSAVSSATGQGTAVIPIDVQHKVIFVPPRPKEMKNKSVWCRPSNFASTSTNLPESAVSKSTSTTDPEESSTKQPLYVPVLIPVPVPIYVPIPMAMYSCPAPVPVAFPLPLPTPVFLPFEPELAERIAAAIQESKKDMEEAEGATFCNELRLSPEPEEPLVDDLDLETRLPTYTIQIPAPQSRKRSLSTSHSSTPSPKRLKDVDSFRSSSDGEESANRSSEQLPSPARLKGGGFLKELGTKAWSRWLAERKTNGSGSCAAPSKALKLSKLSLPEVNSNLIDFASQVRKPDGDTYRPDVLLYLIYGLQLGLLADERRENLFMDAALEPFQLELDTQLKPFYDSLLTALGNDTGSSNGMNTVTTCLKESDLWECRQLGVDSPIVLVFTMLYFNTKFFRLYTAEQHEQLSFCSVQKVVHKRSSFTTGNVVSQNGSPSSSLSKAPAKVYCLQLIQALKPNLSNGPRINIKKPLEQPQIIDRPGICPVKHYNFYVMKCPESVKTSRDLFYLLPETSSTPDSPVWYSTQPVPRSVLARMLRRVFLVEEVIRSLCAAD